MNEILEKTKAAVLQKADPRLVPVINKLVAAGQKVMYGEKSRGMMIKELGDGRDPEKIGAGVAKLVAILFNESKKTAPMQALIPAAVLLMCEGLNFLEEAGTVQVTNEFLSECTMAMGSNVAQMFGATPDKLQGFVDQGKSGQGAAPGAAPGAPPPAAVALPTPAPTGILAGAQQGAI